MSDTITISKTEYDALMNAKKTTDALSIVREDVERGIVYANNTVPFSSLITNAQRTNKKGITEHFSRLTMTTSINELKQFIAYIESTECTIKGTNQISFNTVLWTNAGDAKSPKYTTLQIEDNAYMGELSCSTKKYIAK